MKDLGRVDQERKFVTMLLHEKPRERNVHLGTNCAFPVDRCDHPDAAAFEAYRVWTGFRPWRKSPRIPGLWLIKRAILGAYRWRILSLRSAQRLVDLSKCWEA